MEDGGFWSSLDGLCARSLWASVPNSWSSVSPADEGIVEPLHRITWWVERAVGDQNAKAISQCVGGGGAGEQQNGGQIKWIFYNSRSEAFVETD